MRELIARVLAGCRSLWRNLARRNRREASLDEELQAYVDLLAGEHERAGMSPQAARRAALVESGGLEAVKESTRDAWFGAAAVHFTRELRYAVRSLRRARAFVLVSTVTLAIGIGGAVAVFTVIKGSLLRPLPAVAEPDRLVSLEPVRNGQLLYDFSYPYVLDLTAATHTLSGVAGFDGMSARYSTRDASGSAWVSYVNGDFFSVLGVHPALGRLLMPADEAGGSPVAVVSYQFWKDHLGGAANVVGSTLVLRDHPLTVVGVAPPGFAGAMLMYPMEVWIPFAELRTLGVVSPTEFQDRTETVLRVVGRLAPGRTVSDVQHEMDTIAARLGAAYAADRGGGVRVFRSVGMTMEERAALERMPYLLALAVGLLLLIACANVATLSLVRATARRRELATRLALGASRGSLAARLMIEGAILAALGVAAGIWLADLLVHAAPLVQTVAPMPQPIGVDVTLDGRVLALAAAAAVFTAIVVSLVPLLHIRHLSPIAVLSDGAGGAVRRRSRGQRALVVLQVAASLVLLASAAIVFNTFRRVLATDPGFDPHGVYTIGASTGREGYDPPRTLAFFRQLLARSRSMPNVAASALATVVPPAPWQSTVWAFRPGDEPGVMWNVGDVPPRGHRVYLDVVSPEFFDVMRIRLIAGRGLSAKDDEGGERVAVVSRRLAAEIWPNENPIGKMLVRPERHGPTLPPVRVVGVVADTRQTSLIASPAPVLYVPYAQYPQDVELVVRTRDGSNAPSSAVRALVGEIDPRVSAFDNSLMDRVAGEVRPQEIASAWVGVFGAIALLLAAIGLYGIVAQDVLQRTRELAVRAAVGATAGDLARLVIGDGLRLAVGGVIVGALGCFAALRVLEHEFAGVSATDGHAAVAALALLAIAMLAACALPARRAARLNPVDALRAE